MGIINSIRIRAGKGECRLELDYTEIGRRVARRRKELRLTQSQVAEWADISDQYLSNIERAVSIPSTEVVMRLAIALDTTPDEFLVGTARHEDEAWRSVAQRLRGLDEKQLSLADHFLDWLSEQKL
ncbi:MAG TPA: helix-turn-helix transcriptional regulator [Candidatus Galloscillospira excrementavium]|nr:helix-turn-helix transcriptional regulator [Candidatus Galloscillospira excrementavium]